MNKNYLIKQIVNTKKKFIRFFYNKKKIPILRHSQSLLMNNYWNIYIYVNEEYFNISNK